ncbi:protein translocase subunit SecDF [Pseudaminobacter sp. 19-2017]|uniref:Multifunctional fusion protein n=1 Tax=Pseudaminobacter soli (ex Zhang et al. 2022) TaxID=2831468 RepID=A0A942DX33_9HYPH|nr:protein translocase subunit SecDF [Pseudaminobacter soli]MBS3649629.1 protein translocase subunit SecDF [Pseudaminobacter soli]
MLYFSRWKTIGIWAVVLIGVIFALPNLLSEQTRASLPGWIPSRPMTLGLDLQGGSHILLAVDRNDMIAERLQAVRDDIRTLLRDARIGYTGLAGTGRTVQVRIRDANEVEKAKQALNSLTQPVTSSVFGAGNIHELTLEEPEPGLFRYTLTDEGINYRTSSAVTQSIEVLSRRVNELGTTEPIIQRQGSDRILVQVPGLQDPQRLKEILGQTAKLTFQMVDQSMPVQEAIQGRAPAGSSVLYSTDDPPVPYLIEDRVIVSGENLVDAQATFDQRTNEPVVSFRFDGKGAARFGQATQQNVGRLFAIILDKEVISAPQIREPILGGTGQISGNFTPQSANDLAVLLRAGALPADLTIVEERTVGPSLGEDSIQAGQMAGIVGSVLVVFFMIGAYGFLGWIANVALAANVILLVAILSALGATLTLPGIAGIVLTVGMAVDSNVLIYERIREERRAGRSIIQSVDTGFKKALATILDSNITTLIAAVVLFFLGSGPVRGFAVTLAIGILTTVFTAFTLTRLLVAVWLKRSKPKELPKGYFRLVPEVTRIPFMKVRLQAFAVSMALCLGSIVLLFTVGPNFGIDFTGGTIMEVRAKSGAADIGDIRNRLVESGIGEVQVQGFGSDSDALIRIGMEHGEQEGTGSSIVAKANMALSSDYEIRRTEQVGPAVSGELAWTAIVGVLVALGAILVYVWVRFEWQFAIGAIVSTVNDIILTLGFLVVTQLQFDLSTVAAILTIVGYSLNDTVVIYDRVRENLRRFKKMPLGQLLDLSDNEMLSRTTMTSATTFLALLALFLLGGEVIRSFVASMLFGVFIGTFSSIFIAAPILILFHIRPTAYAPGSEEAKEAAAEAAGPLPAK